MVDILAGSRPIEIGRFQENEHRRLVFPVGDILHQYPDATFQVLHKRPQDDDAYPVSPDQVSVDNGRLYWLLKAADLSYTGDGKCEVVAYSGTVIAKSIKYTVTVDSALGGSATPPEPWQGWVVQVKEDADRAEAAAELLENPGAEAVTLEPGSEATASYSEGVFTFGIPAGVQGQQGQPGKDGADGFSPVASVSKSGSTATITITDKTGTTTASVSDGATGAKGDKGDTGSPGADGFSPIASVSKSGSVATISITDKSGTTTASISDGAAGAKGDKGDKGDTGESGYTPVRGTDYWTAADKAEIVAEAESEFSEDISDIVAELSEQKSEIDGKAPVILRDASGDIVTFTDGADNMPLSSCVVSIDPVQSGTGDPSPTNVRPITGHTGANVYRTGKNLLNDTLAKPTWYQKDADGSVTNTNGTFGWEYASSAFVMDLPAGSYRVYCIAKTATGANSNLQIFNSDNVRLGAYNNSNLSAGERVTGTLNLSTNSTIGVCFKNNGGYCWFMICKSDTPTDAPYTPYVGTTYPISWQTAAGTVYGGAVDSLTGELTVDRVAVDLGSLSWEYTSSAFRSTAAVTGIVAPSTQWGQPQAICERYAPSADAELSNYHFAIGPSSYSYARKIRIMDSTYSGDADAFKTAVTGTKIVCKLTTPQTYQLDPVQITALKESNIWADTGAISLTYPADTRTYVDSAIQTATDPDGNVIQVTGSTPSITGESGKRYVCGTVDSISITPPGTGIIDVVFTSGTTPTVLTVPNTVKFPAWFNPASLDASTVYEINIQDGVYGAVMAWT